MQTSSPSRTVVQVHSKLTLRVPEGGHSLVTWQTGSTPSHDISRITIVTGLDRCVPASHSCGVRGANSIALELKDGFDLFTGAWVSRGPASALGLFYDSRPLFTRSVRLRNHTLRQITNGHPVDAVHLRILIIYDPSWAHSPSHIPYVTSLLTIPPKTYSYCRLLPNLLLPPLVPNLLPFLLLHPCPWCRICLLAAPKPTR
jgi:hypothetical protein